MGLSDKLGLSRLRSSLSRTRENLSSQLAKLTGGKSKLDERLVEQLEEMLIGADAGIDTSVMVVDKMKELARTKKYSDEITLQALLREAVVNHLSEAEYPASDNSISVTRKPYVCMLVGVNGVGKTTSIGKLAYRYREDGKSVMIAAADTFRAAANEQLEVWAGRAGASLLKQHPGADPAAVAFDSHAAARSSGADVLLVDTAGRLHTKVNLMEELRKIRRVLGKADPDAPHEVLLVLDASTGQNGLSQAKQFKDTVGVTGIILTKLDGTAKGGIVLAIGSVLGIPVRYIGVGERVEDLEPFAAERFVEALFGDLKGEEQSDGPH